MYKLLKYGKLILQAKPTDYKVSLICFPAIEPGVWMQIA